MPHNPFAVLGVSEDSSVSQIRSAWRQKAASIHPDVGGTHDEMVILNEALEEALSLAASRVPVRDETLKRPQRSTSKSFISRDVSCFTIGALPVDAWQLLYMSAVQCGPIVDEEEPYVLEFMLSDSSVETLRSSMCRCEIVPEAGASTVHVSVFSDKGKLGNVESVRDLLVYLINDSSDVSDN